MACTRPIKPNDFKLKSKKLSKLETLSIVFDFNPIVAQVSCLLVIKLGRN